MQTLGMLIDQFCVTALKNAFADTQEKKDSTNHQMGIIRNEIDAKFNDIVAGNAVIEFPSNKVYKPATSVIGDPTGSETVGECIAKLMEVNYSMWKNQEYVYCFQQVPDGQKTEVIDRCASLNIERNKWIDAVDSAISRHLKGCRL